ncbi:acyl carrier protein [Streptomyces sp. NPDC093065]|uniref:acyl carrier protein n=1 Tax=Streptomyces sp. NPDC093065 TaxID=3366021 RepID=UPI0038231416
MGPGVGDGLPPGPHRQTVRGQFEPPQKARVQGVPHPRHSCPFETNLFFRTPANCALLCCFYGRTEYRNEELGMWDEQFEEALRRHLPFLAPDEPLEPDTSMRELGLDSLGTVELLAHLESSYNTRFQDDALSLESFATPAVLWETLRVMTEPTA